MPQIGPAEILVVLLVGMLVFGPKRLPEIGRQVGHVVKKAKTFQEAVMSEINGVLELHDEDDVEEPTKTAVSETAS